MVIKQSCHSLVKFGSLLATIQQRDVCPSLKSFEFSTENASAALPFDPSKLIPDQNPSETKCSEVQNGSTGHDITNDDDEEDPFAAYDDTPLVGFGNGEGGEEDMMDDEFVEGPERVTDGQIGGKDLSNTQQQQSQQEFVPGTLGETHYIISNEAEDDDLFSYFDSQMRRGWAGPEHWRVTAIARGTFVHLIADTNHLYSC